MDRIERIAAKVVGGDIPPPKADSIRIFMTKSGPNLVFWSKENEDLLFGQVREKPEMELFYIDLHKTSPSTPVKLDVSKLSPPKPEKLKFRGMDPSSLKGLQGLPKTNF